MFFVAAQLFWAVAQPSNLLIIGLGVGTLALLAGWRRFGMTVTSVATVLYVFCAFGPIGPWLIAPLEDRFPRPANLPEPTGILVLGGGMNEDIASARGTLQLSEAGTRLVEAAALATRFPHARVVFSGGSARIGGATITEADEARAFFTALGIGSERLTLEDRSRNTYENAVFSRNLIAPQPGETWVLVTSAFHMPRSVGIFRKAGFPVVPFPADYMISGRNDWLRWPDAAHSLRVVDFAVREWIGLVAYRLTGRTDTLFPGP